MLYLLLSLLSLTALSADEAPVCHKCQIIREYNAEHPENNYYWYDDYLKDQADKKEEIKENEKPKLFSCNCGNKEETQEREDHLAGCGCGKRRK